MKKHMFLKVSFVLYHSVFQWPPYTNATWPPIYNPITKKFTSSAGFPPSDKWREKGREEQEELICGT